MATKCPGMDPASWKIDDIFDYPCVHCGTMVEFWKDDVKRPCPECGLVSFNPRLGNLCLVWCKKAEDCLGNSDIVEWKNLHGPDKKKE